jgi:hypothetical protein
VSDVDFSEDSMAVVGQPESRQHARPWQALLPIASSEGAQTRAHKIPPMGSRIILSMALGPRHVRMTSATV